MTQVRVLAVTSEGTGATEIRVVLPAHLKNLARVHGEVPLVAGKDPFMVVGAMAGG
jgi:hypothetical protein